MIIILLVVIIMILLYKNELFELCKKNEVFESFGPDINCGGLATLPDMSCGNYKVNGKGLQCVVDNDDCFMENNIKKCYCKQKKV